MRDKLDIFDKIEIPIQLWVNRHPIIMGIIQILIITFAIWCLITLYIVSILAYFGLVTVDNLMINGHLNQTMAAYKPGIVSDYTFNGWENLCMPIAITMLYTIQGISVLIIMLILYKFYNLIKFLYRYRKENL